MPRLLLLPLCLLGRHQRSKTERYRIDSRLFSKCRVCGRSMIYDAPGGWRATRPGDEHARSIYIARIDEEAPVEKASVKRSRRRAKAVPADSAAELSGG